MSIVDRVCCFVYSLTRSSHTHVNIHTLAPHGSIFIPIYFVISKNKIEIFIVRSHLILAHTLLRSLFDNKWIRKKHTYSPLHLEVVMTRRKKQLCAALFSTKLQCHRFVCVMCVCVCVCAECGRIMKRKMNKTTYKADISVSAKLNGFELQKKSRIARELYVRV